MCIRHARYLRSLGAVLALLIAFSALAWSAHVDLPDTHAGTFSKLAMDDRPHDAESAEANSLENHGDHADHCCHASAHLVGMNGCGHEPMRFAASQRPTSPLSAYDSLIRRPLIDPPIA